MKITSTTWSGQPAVRLNNDRYEAMILPDFGANCISLRHLPSGVDLLRSPANAAALANAPNIYGLPVLFPPNRIRKGIFSFQQREYVFPINEPARNNHIHGFLSSMLFYHLGGAVFEYRATMEKPYLSFPHAFTMRRSYTIDEDGLSYTIMVINESSLDMPLGIGVHAAWRTECFLSPPESACRLRIPILQQWELNQDTIIPTGRTVTDSFLLSGLREGTLIPENMRLSCLVEMSSGLAELSCSKGMLSFEFDSDIRFLMLWNDGGGKGFVCIEPQSWLVDAPNLPLDMQTSGFMFLSPGESKEWTFKVRYCPVT